MDTKGKLVVSALGEILWDLFPDRKTLGGTAANFAYHVKALGCTSHLVSAVGDDPLGREAIATLNGKGVAAEFVSVVQGKPTGVVDVTFDAKGKPTYRIAQDTAWDFIGFDAKVERLAIQTDAFCFGSLSQRCAANRQSIGKFLDAMKPDALKIFDINLRKGFVVDEAVLESLRRCDVLKLNDEELPYVARLLGVEEGSEERQVEKLLQLPNLKLIALTKGSDGCRLATREQQVCEPCPKLEALADTVGAGDSFSASLAVGLLKKLPLKEIAYRSNRIAAYVCTQRGATPELPTDLLF